MRFHYEKGKGHMRFVLCSNGIFTLDGTNFWRQYKLVHSLYKEQGVCTKDYLEIFHRRSRSSAFHCLQPVVAAIVLDRIYVQYLSISTSNSQDRKKGIIISQTPSIPATPPARTTIIYP